MASRSVPTSTESTAARFTPGAGLRPQDWSEVISPPEGISDAVAALLPPGEGSLPIDRLEALAALIATRADLWGPLVIRDESRRRYRLMYEDDRVDIWVLSWMPGQGTGFHDHDISSVGLAVAQGMLVERQMLIPTGATRLELRPGMTRQGGPGYIHSAGWGAGDPTVSIHAYSPPLMNVGQYRADEHGVMRRHIEHGRQELKDHTIAALDPSRADG